MRRNFIACFSIVISILIFGLRNVVLYRHKHKHKQQTHIWQRVRRSEKITENCFGARTPSASSTATLADVRPNFNLYPFAATLLKCILVYLFRVEEICSFLCCCCCWSVRREPVQWNRLIETRTNFDVCFKRSFCCFLSWAWCVFVISYMFMC